MRFSLISLGILNLHSDLHDLADDVLQLGMLLFLVGLFVTVPISTLALAYVYRQLLVLPPENAVEAAPSNA